MGRGGGGVIVLAALAAVAWHPSPCLDQTPGGEGRCAERDLTKAEQGMQMALQQTIGRLRHCKPINSTACDDMPRAIALVQAEQRTWKAWRDAHCDTVAFSVEHTSVEASVRADCRTELTTKRTDELVKIGRAK